MLFEVSNPSTGHVYDDRVPLEKAVNMIAGDKEENEQHLIVLEEDAEMMCRSKHIPSFKLALRKVSLGEIIEGG